MKFEVKNPDLAISPYTGMTREHWLDVCEFLLDGIFSNLEDFETLVYCPRTEFYISYPQENGGKQQEYEEKFEGLARSFLIAAPLLHNRPDTVIRGIPLKEYYKEHILSAVTPGTQDYMLSLRELRELTEGKQACFQHTCECASLAIGLWQCREVIWESYTEREREQIGEYLKEFGSAVTSAHNWRLFNMLILGFLWREGYDVDETIIKDHAQTILSYYAGDGWYRDGHRFDYYCPWAFHVYSVLWNVWYGYEKEPEIAQLFERYTNEFLENYIGMFDRDGHITMWGRSGIYRNAATAPFATVFLLKNHRMDPGLARRINSGALLQFMSNEKVFENGVPTLGFYDTFPPILQDYSCAESPFWIANPFLCLNLPEDHPFWTETETNGDWDILDIGLKKSFVMDGPGIVAFHQGRNGAAEFCTAKNIFSPEDDYIKAYMRVAFHSRYPWEAFDFGGVEAMQYCLQYEADSKVRVPNIMLYGGVKNGVLYRQQYFEFRYNFQGLAGISLADIPLSNGILHVDRVRIHKKPYILTLGAYGFPKEDEVKIERFSDGLGEAIIVKNDERSLALVTYTGFDFLDKKERHGVNAVEEESILLYAGRKREKLYEGKDHMLVYSVLTEERKEFEWDELFPVKRINFAGKETNNSMNQVEIWMKSGEKIQVDFEGLEGNLRI